MAAFNHLAQQLQTELRPLMRDADISPCIQQALLARLTLFLLFTSQQPPLTLSVRVPQPLEGAELTLYFADARQITLLTRHIRVLSSPNDRLYDTMITLQQCGKQLVQKACFSWEIGRVVHTYCNPSAWR
jgi:hypothetical protein